MKKTKSKLWNALSVALVIIGLYLAAATLRYRLIHPEMTETQLYYQHLFDAWMWRD